MKTPERNYFKKIGLLLLFFIVYKETALTQITCNEPIRLRENITLCQGDIFQFGDKTITSSGIYVQTFNASNNCDSIVTLGVDYLNNSNFSFTETITTNESYFFNEQDLRETGIYRDTLVNIRGCDSMLTLTLEVIKEQENCENGVDDDGDGLIDAFDSDCLCLLTGTPVNLIPNGGFEEKVGCCRGIGEDEELCMDNWVNLSLGGFIYHNPDCWAVLGQELVIEGIQLESGFVGGYIWSGENGTELSGFSLGICLEEPMYAGNTYQLSFDLGRSFKQVTGPVFDASENMHWTINGITDCEKLKEYQFTTDFCSKGLPVENLTTIDLFNLEPGWNHFELTITPETRIEAIFLGGDCGDELGKWERNYLFYDNLSITAENGLRINNIVNIEGNTCEGDLQLSIPNTDNLTVDWYKDSLALPEISGRPFIITPEIIATKNGVYHAKVTFEDGRCQLVGPLVVETFDLELPSDTTLCPDQNLFLSFAQTGVQYEWQDGSSQPFFMVNKEGTYWVEGQKENCVIRDSILVSYAEQRSFLPNDTTICGPDHFLIAPKPPFDHVLWWENPLVLDSLLVEENGLYHAFIIDQGCDWFDSIYVAFIASPELDLGKDTTLCEGENLTLTVPSKMTNYQWQNGMSNATQLITQSDLYWLMGTIGSCTVQDSILVTFEDCLEDIPFCQTYLPNSFSPNGDGINDELQLLTDCELQFFEMEVYDRWGSLVFSTTDVRQAWDGTANGELLDTGVYLWVVRYQFLEEDFLVEKVETVTVLR